MGAVALTEVQQLGQWPWDVGQRAVLAKCTMSSSYATNGDTVAGAVTLGLRRVTQLLIVSEATSGTYGKVAGRTVAEPIKGYKITLAGTQAAPKIILTKGDASPAEEANATNVSAQIFYAIFIGEV